MLHAAHDGVHADWLAERGWDVWVVELRGNGLSDKANLLAGRSRW